MLPLGMFLAVCADNQECVVCESLVSSNTEKANTVIGYVYRSTAPDFSMYLTSGVADVYVCGMHLACRIRMCPHTCACAVRLQCSAVW